MVNGDAPALFSKACEYFVLELTVRAWIRTQSCTRETIMGCDFFEAVRKSETYGFLINRVPFGPYCAIHQVSFLLLRKWQSFLVKSKFVSTKNVLFKLDDQFYVLNGFVQGVPEHAEPEHVLPRAEMMLPDMNVPFDMKRIEQVNHLNF